MYTFISGIRPSLCILAVFTVLCGVVYPFICFGMLHTLFKHQSQGSLIYDKQGKPLGSELIGQSFSSPQYFWGRPSSTESFPYNAASSQGSNLGANSIILQRLVAARIQKFKTLDPSQVKSIPVDLVTASASGLDPEISVAAALYQVPRIAKMRHKTEAEILKLVDRFTQGKQLKLLGEQRVNVLKLNLALDGKQ